MRHWPNIENKTEDYQFPMSAAPVRKGSNLIMQRTIRLMTWWSHALECYVTDHIALLSVVLQLGTLCQQPFKTYRHHHPVSAAISKLNFFPGHMVLIHSSTFMAA